LEIALVVSDALVSLCVEVINRGDGFTEDVFEFVNVTKGVGEVLFIEYHEMLTPRDVRRDEMDILGMVEDLVFIRVKSV
jgi:hypothetical protein